MAVTPLKSSPYQAEAVHPEPRDPGQTQTQSNGNQKSLETVSTASATPNEASTTTTDAATASRSLWHMIRGIVISIAIGIALIVVAEIAFDLIFSVNRGVYRAQNIDLAARAQRKVFVDMCSAPDAAKKNHACEIMASVPPHYRRLWVQQFAPAPRSGALELLVGCLFGALSGFLNADKVRITWLLKQSVAIVSVLLIERLYFALPGLQAFPPIAGCAACELIVKNLVGRDRNRGSKIVFLRLAPTFVMLLVALALSWAWAWNRTALGLHDIDFWISDRPFFSLILIFSVLHGLRWLNGKMSESLVNKVYGDPEAGGQ